MPKFPSFHGRKNSFYGRSLRFPHWGSTDCSDTGCLILVHIFYLMRVLFPKVISRYSLLVLPVLPVAQKFHLVGSKMFPRVSEPQYAQLDKTRAERGITLFPVCLLWQKSNFYPAWKTVRSVTGQDLDPLFSNTQLRHNHHKGLDNCFMPELIHFSGQFPSLACILPPWGTSPVTDKWDGDLWKC